MKKLFFYATCLLLLACSSDDDNPQTEGQQPDLRIKKFTQMIYHSDPNDNVKVVRTFDQSGRPIRESEEYTDNQVYWLFSYNNSDLISERTRHYQDGSKFRADEFHYNLNNQIDSLVNKDAQGNIGGVTYYNHSPNKITYHHGLLQGEYNYNADGIITKIHANGDFSSSTITITYSSDNISQITTQRSTGETETLSFQYDNKLNPLHPNFHNNYFNSTIGEFVHFLYKENYFSKNNFTQINYTHTDPSNNYTITKNTTYDADGYFLSAEIKKNNVLVEEQIYEYY